MQETSLFGERREESAGSALGWVKRRGASLGASRGTPRSWEQLPRPLSDPVQARRAHGPLAEQPTSAKGRTQG